MEQLVHEKNQQKLQHLHEKLNEKKSDFFEKHELGYETNGVM